MEQVTHLEDLTVSYQKPEKSGTPIVPRSQLTAGTINLHWFNLQYSKAIADIKEKGFQIKANGDTAKFSYGSYFPAEKGLVECDLNFQEKRLIYINLVIDS